MDAWQDKQEICEVVQQWALWRDSGNWEPLRTSYTTEGRMTTMWFDGPADDFVAACRAGAGKGNTSGHFICGSTVRVNGGKALANSRLILLMRTRLDGVPVDLTSNGRFIDRLVRENGKWGIHHRRTIYDKDRMDPVVPGASLQLDTAELQGYAEGYRNLAYIQKRAGRGLTPNTPTLGSEILASLYRDDDAWLAA
ncbi:MAG: nuclear transport factor 2 family protein [Betaproteobacteria bacterium]|nr:nuclear transport factor 2 family protein [Betaproteobacteria bacterium]